jgi:glycosyltransferase involved in cell wall biosynthesis
LPTASVIIPTFNGSAFLAEAVASVWRQSRLPDELIVVDDCSTDDTVAVADRLRRHSPVPMTVHRLPHNSGGPAGPMNTGVDLAAAPLVALCDQDDLLPPDRLARQVAALTAVPDAGLACGANTAVGADGRPLGRYTYSAESWSLVPGRPIGDGLRVVAKEHAYRSLLRAAHSVGGGSSMCFPKDVWRRVGGFDPKFRVAWDYDFAVRVAARYDFLYDATPLSYHRLHDANLGHRHDLETLETARVRWRHYRRPAFCVSPAERRAALARSSLELAYGLREQGRYVASAGAYCGHLAYGNKVRAVSGLAKLVVLPLIPRRLRSWLARPARQGHV